MQIAATPERLTDEQRERLARLVNSKGVPAACKRLGLTREAIARLCAGLPTKRATLIVASAAIDALPPTAPAPPTTVSRTAGGRPEWLTRWASAHLNDKQRAALEAELAKHAPSWARR